MSQWKQYRRTNIAEMREVTDEEIGAKCIILKREPVRIVSISQADLENGSPKKGDMVARNPNDHADQWLVAKEYFEENFEEL